MARSSADTQTKQICFLGPYHAQFYRKTNFAVGAGGGVPPQTKNVVFLLAPSLAQLWGKKSFSVGLGVHGKKRRFFGGLAEVVVFAPMPPGVCGAHKAALKKRLLCGL